MTSERTKLTKTFVDSLPLSPDKQVIYQDSELIGFALRLPFPKFMLLSVALVMVNPQYSLGKHGEITPTQARIQATKLLGLMAQVCPNQEKQRS
jgi:hypothetical protein